MRVAWPAWPDDEPYFIWLPLPLVGPASTPPPLAWRLLPLLPQPAGAPKAHGPALPARSSSFPPTATDPTRAALTNGGEALLPEAPGRRD